MCFLLPTQSQGQSALLDGKEILYQYKFPNVSTVYRDNSVTAVVGPGAEIADAIINDGINGPVDFSNTNIRFDFDGGFAFSPAVFNGVHISDDSGTIAPFTKVTINPATNLPGFDLSRVSFDQDNIYLNFQGLDLNASPTEVKVVSIDIETTLSPTEAIQELVSNVALLNLANGIDNSLDTKLDAALNAFDDANSSNDVAAVNALVAFINAAEAQAGNKIDIVDASILIDDALFIIALLLDG